MNETPVSDSPSESTPKQSNNLTHNVDLSDKQTRFCYNYLDCASETFQNATLSAKKAGFSNKSAKMAGYRLLLRPKIKQFIQELETSIASKLHWDRSRYEAEAVKSYEGLPLDSANRFKYFELIGKIMGFLEPQTLNTFIFSNMDKDTIAQRVRDITHKLSNSSMLRLSQADQSQGIGIESGVNTKWTPPPDISINSPVTQPIDNKEVTDMEASHEEGILPSAKAAKPVAEDKKDVEGALVVRKSDGRGYKEVPEPVETFECTPTWAGCKHDLKLTSQDPVLVWTCSKCGETA